jgi:hypothetical protein
VRQAVLETYSNVDISVSIVWIPMVEGDSLDAAQAAARTIVDLRARHFYDAEHRAGKAIASVLGGEGEIAWDTYLFYPKGSVWKDRPPIPQFWMHQLAETNWADAAHHHSGDDLVRELGNSMSALGFTTAIHVD